MVWSLAPKKSTTVEFTDKLLWIPKYQKNYNSIQRAAQKVRFALFCNIVYEISIPYQALELHGISLLNPFLRAFIKIYYFPIFHCHIVNPLKSSPIFDYFQWNCIATLFILQIQRSLFGLFSKACLKILQLLPSS